MRSITRRLARYAASAAVLAAFGSAAALPAIEASAPSSVADTWTGQGNGAHAALADTWTGPSHPVPADTWT
jgi:hypothetical protein